MGSSDSAAAQHIHMVHRLIEECIVLKMNKQDCMDALSKHANIHPLITHTVWNELKKENKDFFDDYEKTRGSEVTRDSRSDSPMDHDGSTP